MGRLFCNGKVPAQGDLKKIVRCLNRVTNPVRLGIISLDVNDSLARTQEMLDLLEESGIVRKDPVDPALYYLGKAAGVYEFLID